MTIAQCRLPNAALPNDALEKPLRRSRFRALVWKEWRQQRWIFLSLAGLAYFLLASAAVVRRYGIFFQDLRTDAAAVLGGCAILLGVVGVVVLSANAFAGERDDNTDLFLETIPCSRSKLFGVKLGFVLFLILLELIPVGVAALIMQLKVSLGDFMVGAGLTAAGVLVLATVPALIASFGGSVIATILASLPVIGACHAYMYSPALSARFLFIRSPMGNQRLFALFTALLVVTILLAARRMWIRVERTWSSSLRTAAVTAGLLIAYVAAPVVAAYLYVTFLAPLSFFFTSSTGGMMFGPGPTLAAETIPAPNGKYVAFATRYGGWASPGTRVALMDMESGRTRWLTRFRLSILGRSGGTWSPSGNQFLLREFHIWLWPFAPRDTAKPTYFVVDARSGEKRSFDDLCPGLPHLPTNIMSLVGWYDEQVFAFSNGRDVFFADIEHHQVRQCKMPAASPPASFQERPLITQRGMFAVSEGPSAEGGMSILRYAPDIPEAESLLLRGIARNVPRREASEDGQWLILTQELSARQQNVWYLARLADEAKAMLLVSETGEGEKGLIPPSWQVKGFIPGSHRILLYSPGELGLFDADSHDLREIPVGAANNFLYIASAELSPAGALALAYLDQVRGVPFDRNEVAGPDYVVVDLKSGAVGPRINLGYERRPHWLGEDRLLLEQYGKMPWVINRDGTGARPLLNGK